MWNSSCIICLRLFICNSFILQSTECLQPLSTDQGQGQSIFDAGATETKTPVPTETFELQTAVSPIPSGIEPEKGKSR